LSLQNKKNVCICVVARKNIEILSQKVCKVQKLLILWCKLKIKKDELYTNAKVRNFGRNRTKKRWDKYFVAVCFGKYVEAGTFPL
jgi:hypothetical protein